MRAMIKAFIILVIFIQVAVASDMQDARQQASGLVGSASTYTPNTSTNLEEAVPGYVTSNPTETQYGSGDMYDAARDTALTHEGSLLVNKSHAERPEFEINKETSPIFQKAESIIDNPNTVIDSLTGRYEACSQEGGEAITQTTIKTCDEYTEMSDQMCQVGQRVEVDAQHKYQCSKDRKFNDYKCTRNLTLQCASTSNCSSNELPTSYSTGTLGWGGKTCYAKSFFKYFNVSNVQDVSEFVLSSINYAHFAEVIINGTSVFAGPYGGSNLSAGRVGRWSYWVKDNGTNRWKCSTGGTYNVSPNINLKPYLGSGSNTIEVRVINNDKGGFANLTFRAQKRCCSQWQEIWSDNCGGYQ